ncbi:MAG: M23 family metallopeptidase [Gemmatimonadales bacterium]
MITSRVILALATAGAALARHGSSPANQTFLESETGAAQGRHHRGGALAPSLPDSAGIPTIALTTARAPNGDIWVGTYGRGIFIDAGKRSARSGEGRLRRLVNDTSSTSISMNFVNAIAFGAHGEIWYGTIGNGWGLSVDGGKHWKNWTFAQLGPEWQYVAPDGIRVRGDTVAIATADGLQVTTDNGTHWTAFGDAVGPPAKGPADTMLPVLPNEYLLGYAATPAARRGSLPLRLLGNRTAFLPLSPCLRAARGDGAARCTVADTRFGPAIDPAPIGLTPVKGPVPGSAKGWSPWFARPIGHADNDRNDQTYRWGSTMGGFFQPHQGIEFNNPDGTLVHAIGSGTVVYAGRAERGALTVSIRHDSMLTIADKHFYVFSVYYHNSKLRTTVGTRVARGDVISEVGHTGRATNDHMHLEVHAAPTDSVKSIVDSLNRYPPYTTNPELWITPLPGTGIIAGTVVDSAGIAIPQAHIYGVKKPLPAETPFVFAETYGPRNRPHPLYGEHFALTDVPAGSQTLFVVIGGKRITRTVTVRPGAMTWVEFRP